VETTSWIGDQDHYLLREGTHYHLYEKLGSHVRTVNGVKGVQFAVWAPNAERVSVTGDFSGWSASGHPLQATSSGVWQGFVPDVEAGTRYKYHVVSREGGYRVDKADPFAFRQEAPPRTASYVWNLDYRWGDAEWMANRRRKNSLASPIAIYEVHVGSWRRVPEEDNRSLTYRELAPLLADYVERMGYTHVELMPIMEHPFYGSWGYQVTGYFAPTSRYGTPQDFMFLVDHLHQRGIGVILDWVPSHFPSDEHGLCYFDGTHLFEHADPRQGFHPDWKSYIFNYGRNEIPSFLISSAMMWLDKYHADGLRVDAVASMLYLDYSRSEGEWIPNRYGGRENLEAIAFLRRMNQAIYDRFPDVQTIAEESTSWPMVSRPVYVGGLGFGLKWDMGWMHDTLRYFARDPIHRRFHHQNLTFRLLYAFQENFLLPLSHDEVVHGKGSLLERMPGDLWQKFANLRLLFGYMYGQSGKKLLFMGGDFGQWNEWYHEANLDWHLLKHPAHAGIARWVADLNQLYRSEPAMHVLDSDGGGFEWIDANDSEQSVLTFLRKGKQSDDLMLIACNLTPIVRQDYRVGIPSDGEWQEVLNSDAATYGGSGQGNLGGVMAEAIPSHGRPWSLNLRLPPLSAVFFKRSRPRAPLADTPEPEPPAVA
jgi:1,4-alpha-glucan branching enzyme